MTNNSSSILLAMDIVKFKESLFLFYQKTKFPLISKFNLAFDFMHIIYFFFLQIIDI